MLNQKSLVAIYHHPLAFLQNIVSKIIFNGADVEKAEKLSDDSATSLHDSFILTISGILELTKQYSGEVKKVG